MKIEKLKRETNNYLVPPGEQSCYRYMLECNEKITRDIGDRTAFVNIYCETSVSRMIADIENFAAFLSEKGFKKNDVISVFLPTSAHAFIAFYALSKLGITADFIHPMTPPALLEETMAFTRSKGIIILDKLAPLHCDVIKDRFAVICRTSDYTEGKIKEKVMEQEAPASKLPTGENIYMYGDIMAEKREKVADSDKKGRETAVYMHGSGTTGKSKTVQLSAYAFNSMAYSHFTIDAVHNYGNAYSLCVLPCFHAFGLGSSMHYCVCNAYSSIVMPKFDPVQANDYISKYHVQHIVGAPTMFRKMFEAQNFVNPGLKNLTMLYSGGDIVSESFIVKFTEAIQEQGSRAVLFRGWGLTEMCAVGTTNNHYDYKADSIGKHAQATEIQILDENKKPLPPLSQGEIAIRGTTMMNGYLPDKDLNGNGIWTDENGRDWILTGDMGYLDDEDFLFFTGRKKRIIVISGYNVYPYNMEQKLGSLPFINEVCAVQGYKGEKPIVKLCLTLKEGTKLSPEEVKEEIMSFSRKELDHFSVPGEIIIMDSLPRTKMDKLDFMKMSDKAPFNPAE